MSPPGVPLRSDVGSSERAAAWSDFIGWPFAEARSAAKGQGLANRSSLSRSLLLTAVVCVLLAATLLVPTAAGLTHPLSLGAKLLLFCHLG